MDAAPRGSAATLAGIVASGIGGYGSLALVTNLVDPAAQPALAAAWTLLFLAGPAVYFPLEQALAGRLLRGEPARVARSALALGGGLAAVTLLAWPVLVRELFDGRDALVLALLLSYAGYAAQHVARALLLAQGRFGRYAAVLAVDGLLRLAGCAAVALAGSRSPEAFAFVAAAAPLAGTLACAGGLRRPAGGGPGVGRDVTHLLVGFACSQAIVGAGPAVLKALAGSDLVPAYLVNVALTRVPLLLGQALLAPLLAGLAGALREGSEERYRALLARTGGTVLLGGAVTVAGFAVAAPAVVRVVFGEHAVLGHGPAAVLAACAVAALAGQLLTQALVARGRAPRASAGWLAALAASGVALAVWPGGLGRVLGATAVGSVVAVALLARLVQTADR